MRTLSFPTLGLAYEIAVELFDKTTELVPLLMRCGLLKPRHTGEIHQVVLTSIMGARAEAEDRNDVEAHRALLCFVQLIVEKRISHPRGGPLRRQMGELREALLADGYELTWTPGSDLPGDYTARCTIRPTDASPVPLGTEISALEAELDARGYGDALNHYKQAVGAFDRHEYEAANSQLRTALEDLVMHLAEDHTSYRRAKAGDGSNAIKQLVQRPALVGADGGDMLEGLWKMSHTKGSHPGRSDADETRFRIHAITATARLLLHRFPARP